MSSDARELQRICQVIAQAGARPGLDERELVTRFFEEGSKPARVISLPFLG